jgi:GTP-binding protein
MFLDKAKIYVKGGNGGDGIVSYRRELYVPMGGPAGGDGGNGGDVVFVVDEGLRTLIDFRYQKHFKAPVGEKGKNKSRQGANAEDMIVKVPPGTVVLDEDSGEILADLTRHGQSVVVAKGGRGGRGNIRFATAANPAPGISENGEEGKERYLVLELKVMADVGLIGFPSVGKSTLLSVVSAATPKIGAYHFTTITPNLGVVDVGDGRSFVMADLPGLIEGANEGIGLGHEFLRHIERTRVLVHIIDMSAVDGRVPYEDWVMINRELELYNPVLLTRPQLLVANKMDSPGAEEHLEIFRRRLADEGKDTEVIPISAITKDGIQQVLYKCADILEKIPNAPAVEEVKDVSERKVYQAEEKKDESFEIRRENDMYIIESPHIENMIKRMNFSTQEAADRFARIMSKMGIDKALRLKGAKDGNYVRIGEFEFEFVEQE